MSQPQQIENQKDRLVFEKKKVEDQAKTIQEQAERIAKLMEGGQ
tara:strand:+ start:1405 stop:1536 length:132 start_codon:yes stop_codon:yes gene_type:complete